MIVYFTKPGADCRDSWCSTLLVVGRGRGSHPCSWSASLWSTARRASSDSLFILHLRDPLLKIWKFVDEHFSCLTFCSGKICKCRHFHWRSCMWNGLEHFPQIVYVIITKHDRGLTDQYVIFVNVLIKLPTDGSTSPIVILGPQSSPPVWVRILKHIEQVLRGHFHRQKSSWKWRPLPFLFLSSLFLLVPIFSP